MAVLLNGAMREAHNVTSGTARRSRNRIVLIVAPELFVDPVLNALKDLAATSLMDDL